MPRRLTRKEYEDLFGRGENPDPKIQGKALEHALDIRKFEIGLYWTRATYFWTFIAAALAGYGAVQTIDGAAKTDLSVFISCLGFVFSFAWYCVNRGSKQWQENWENHVDFLEDAISGPLYKVLLKRPNLKKKSGVRNAVRFGRSWLHYHLTGPYPFSVSKINQLISVYVSVFWILLLIHSLPEFKRDAEINWAYVSVILLTAATSGSLLTLGRTHGTDYEHIAEMRESDISNPE